MNKVSGGQRGISVGMVLFGLAVAVVIAALSKGCDEEPVSTVSPASLPPPAPAVLPAPAPPVIEQAAETAPAPAPARPPGASALVVHNPCDQGLLMAVSFVGAGGQRVTEGFFQVGPGARMQPATRSGPIYLVDKTIFFYTETEAAEPVEQGRRDEIVADRQVGMKQVHLDPPAAPAVSTITLECPGATSGRP